MADSRHDADWHAYWKRLRGHPDPAAVPAECPGCGSPEPWKHPRDGRAICPHPWHHADQHAQAPDASPAITAPQPEENTMSALTDAKQILHNGLDELEKLDEDAVTMLEVVRANPQLWEAFRKLASMGSVTVPDGSLNTAIDVLTMTQAKLGVPQTDPQPA
jgi:uncharacterized Zn finger protein (UPF0148 family)